MDESGFLQDNVKNKLKYELYLSRYPDDQLINSYRKHIASLIKKEDLSDEKNIFPLKKHTSRNLLYGFVRFDQNIEEEWFIIYLLFELSKYDQDLVIKVHDSDGDILLIEAAEHLPNWLESSKSKNRVFIHKGHLHIIPENVDLKELLSNYQTFLSSPSSSSTFSPQPHLTVTQVSAQYVREMNRLAHSKTAAVGNYGCSGSGGASGSSTSSGGDGCGSQNNQNYFENLGKVDTLANSTIQRALREQLAGMPDKKVWLSKKFKQLDEIISVEVTDDVKNLNKKFRESLSLASVMAMNNEDLRISPISSASSSAASSLSAASSSSSWMSEQQND